MGEHNQEVPVPEGGAGGDALAGYEYQIDVSVWLALDLILASRLAQELVLEPASQEDIEADLQDHEPSRVISEISTQGYKLVVQAKLRGGDAWTVRGIKSLLQHGSENRVSAAKRLASPAVRYLLVTSAALNGGTRGLRVRRAGVWPKAADMPSAISKALPEGAPGRVAVIGNQDEERLEADIRRLLTERFRVPNARWQECRLALREEARIRINRGGSGRWIREDLEQVIRRYEGYIASSAELEHYVHPTNWEDLKAAIRERHAALIIGQSGTGKTTATRQLYEELRQEIPGLARIRITQGPWQVRDDQTPPPVLYDIEDPWGRYGLDSDSRPWNDQLAQCFRRATHDRIVVATSRLDVAQSSGALDRVEQWLVKLEAEHYGARERSRLFRAHINAVPRELRRIAERAESTVLAELKTPLEIQKFFDALPMMDREELKSPHRLVSEAISKAHRDSIEQTIIDQIGTRQDTRAAAVVWGLLKASDRLSLSGLRELEERLADEDANFEKGIEPLISFFIAARNLRQTEDSVAYYHPRVESGIERALVGQALVARRALRSLVSVLTCLEGTATEWGVAAAAKLVAAASKVPGLDFDPQSEAHEKIDAWLEKQVTGFGKEFMANLKLAATAGSAASTVAEVARYLLQRPDRSFGGLNFWGPPNHDESWYARLRSDVTVRPVIETFIRDVLPEARDFYQADFARDIERLAPSLSGTFLDAAKRSVYFGVIYSSGAIAEGALQDLEGFEGIVDIAVEVLTPTDEERRKADETLLAITNGEYSEDYADYLSDNDEGYTAREFLESYVDRVRKVRSWRCIIRHRHHLMLFGYWLRALEKQSTKAALDQDELAGAFTAAYGGPDEIYLWSILLHRWAPDYLDALVARVAEGHASEEIRHAALRCLVSHAPHQLDVISHLLLALGGLIRLTELAVDLAEVCISAGRDDEVRRATESAFTWLPAPYAEIGLAAIELAKKDAPVLSRAAHDIIGSIQGGGEGLRRFRVVLDQYFILPVDEDIRWLLANTNDSAVAVEAVNAAIRRGMAVVVEAALNHRFAHVAAQALTAVATPIPAPLPAHILAFVAAKGRRVREALVRLLGTKPHEAHLPVLLQIVQDKWSRHSAHYDHRNEGDFPIAREAVAAIERLGSLQFDVAEQLYGIAVETSDPRLRYALFALLAKAGGFCFQERLFELAIASGHRAIGREASNVLLGAYEHLSPKLIARINPALLASSAEPVAVSFVLLFSWRAEPEVVRQAAQELATSNQRRLLLVLMIWLVRERAMSVAEQIASMLPVQHVAVTWALGKDQTVEGIDDSILADLGTPTIVAEVLKFMRVSGQQTDQD